MKIVNARIFCDYSLRKIQLDIGERFIKALDELLDLQVNSSKSKNSFKKSPHQ